MYMFKNDWPLQSEAPVGTVIYTHKQPAKQTAYHYNTTCSERVVALQIPNR